MIVAVERYELEILRWSRLVHLLPVIVTLHVELVLRETTNAHLGKCPSTIFPHIAHEMAHLCVQNLIYIPDLQSALLSHSCKQVQNRKMKNMW
jgi:hypothetical protein